MLSELERRKDHNSIAKEQKAFRKYFSKPELMRNWEESEWNNYATQNQICEEDYCRQEEDRMTGKCAVTLSQTTNFRPSQTERVRRRQFQIC